MRQVLPTAVSPTSTIFIDFGAFGSSFGLGFSIVAGAIAGVGAIGAGSGACAGGYCEIGPPSAEVMPFLG